MNYGGNLLERLSERGKAPVRPAWIIFATHKCYLVAHKCYTYLSYCRELMKIVPELHQLDGIKGNFMISEREYLAILIEEGKIAPPN
jgi:hypothetical protein